MYSREYTIMTKENKLIKQLEIYLEQKGKEYHRESLLYKGLREDVPQKDGSIKSMYAVHFSCSISQN
mgnify:CR=1 FL=1